MVAERLKFGLNIESSPAVNLLSSLGPHMTIDLGVSSPSFECQAAESVSVVILLLTISEKTLGRQDP